VAAVVPRDGASYSRKKAPLLVNAQFKIDHLEQSNLRRHYEDMAANMLLSIVRHKLLIASLVIMALVLAGLLIPQLPRKYAAEALVHPDLFSREAGAKSSPLASIEGASLVTSEARLIRADAMVRTVVKRLGLDRDPEFAAPTSPVSQAVDRVWAAILPETQTPSPLERAIASVRKKLTVTNDTRSYLISISFTAASPETAAKVANAFGVEYLSAKTTQRLADAATAAHREFAQRSAIYGEKHPSVVRADAELEAARVRLQVAANRPDLTESDIVTGEGITLAVPNPTPSSPKGLVILGLVFVCALVSGLGLAVWLDRRDTGFHDEKKVLARTGVPCLGMVPQFSDPAAATLSLDTVTALRAVAVAAGLIGAAGLKKVAMVTSALPREGTSAFAAGLAKVLVSEGQRVLLVDSLSQRQLEDGAMSLEEVRTAKARRAFFEASGAGPLAILRRTWEAEGPELSFAAAQRAFKRLLADARDHFDIVLIAAPPVMFFAETVHIGRNADITLYVARWNRTPQRAVDSAIQRLRDGAVEVHGIVLTDVNVRRHGKPRSISAKISENAVPTRAGLPQGQHDIRSM
jgi:Mrp family chromosome partitioning ATPase/capsular polysaccharide biosynthesis protein